MKKMFLVIVLLFSILLSFGSVKAKEVKLENMDIITRKIRENGEIKVQIELSFETCEDIVIQEISSTIHGQSQKSLNVSQTKEKTLDGDVEVYNHYIVYVVENWQIGTMSLEIKYLNATDFSVEVIDFYIPGGKWQSSDISFKNAIMFGVFASFMIGLATVIIVDSSRKGFMDVRDE